MATLRERTDAVVSSSLTILFFVLYVSTMCPTVFWYDSAEFVTAAHTLGIPHPPGSPLYVLLAHLFSYLPGDPARAINAFSAVSAAVAVGLVYLVSRKLGARTAGSILSAVFVGVGPTFWFHGLIAEVYAPAVVVLLIVLLLLLGGLERNDGRWFVGAGVVAGLGLGIHLGIATCGLGFAVLVMSLGVPGRIRGGLWSKSGIKRRVGWALAAGLGALFGACIFLWLPIRAAMEPTLLFAVPPTWENLWWYVSGGPYGGLMQDVWLSKDRWLWLADQFMLEASPAGFALAATGFVWLVRQRPIVALAWGLCILGNVVFFFNYLAHDAHVFFLPAYVLLGCLVGLALEWFANRHRLRLVVASVAGLAAAWKFVGSFREVDLGDYDDAQRWGEQVCAEIRENAIIVTFTTPGEWKFDMVFSHYFQVVLEQRPDVRVIAPAGPLTVAQFVRAGYPVYTYVPFGVVASMFQVRPEAGVFRVGAPLVPESELEDWHIAR